MAAQLAVVTLMVPFQLQIMADALRLYADEMDDVATNDERETLMPLYNGNPGLCRASARVLLTEIGMGVAEDRVEDLPLFTINEQMGMVPQEGVDSD